MLLQVWPVGSGGTGSPVVACSPMRRLSGALAPLLLAVLLATAVVAAPGGAQDVGNDPTVISTREELYRIQNEARAAAEQLAKTNEQLAVLESRIGDVAARVADHETRINVLVTERSALLGIVRTRAAYLYRTSNVSQGIPLILTGPPLVAARREALGRAATRQDRVVMRQLKDTTTQLSTARDALRAEQAGLEGELGSLTDLRARQRSLQRELDRKVADANQAYQQAIQLGILRLNGGQPIQGPSVLTSAQLAGWWRSKNYSPPPPGQPQLSVSIDELAAIYVQEGADEGVRGDMAFAQAILETGGFRYTAPGNNFAGMGWCDSCSSGRTFPTPRDGVRAQVQHLLNYADITSRHYKLHHPASIYWYAPISHSPSVANQQFDSFFAKGWAPTWHDMGHGNWATDPNYSTKVLNIYQQMLDWAGVS